MTYAGYTQTGGAIDRGGFCRGVLRNATGQMLWTCEHEHLSRPGAVACAYQAEGIAKGGGWLPETRAELEAAGYRFDTMGVCRGVRCHDEIAWWYTPKGKRIPLNPDGTAHWATCIDAAQFGTKRRRGSGASFVKD